MLSGQYRRGTNFDFQFPTLPSLHAVPQSVDIYQEVYNHDLLVLNFDKFSHTWFSSLKRGVPVRFTWTQGTRKKVWIGYVDHVHREAKAQRITPTKIICIGASAVLKQTSQEVFKKATITEVAAKIAKKYKLHFDGVPHTKRFAHLPIAGKTYWAWLVEHAKLIGYAVYVDGVTLVFKPLDNILNTSSKNSPLLSMSSTMLPINNQVLDRTLDELTVTYGDYVEGLDSSNTNKIVAGVDPHTGKPMFSTSVPKELGLNLRSISSGAVYDEYRTSQVVNDLEALQAASKGAAQLARFTIPAKTGGQGDSRARPFFRVRIEGTGSVTDGSWVVFKAHHIIHRVGDYMMDLHIATDGIGADTVSPLTSSETLSGDGVVNIDDVLLSDGDGTNFVEVNAFIESKTPMFAENFQGFVNNPVHWRASYRSQEGCCN